MFEDCIFDLDIDPDGMSNHDPPVSLPSSSASYYGNLSLAKAPPNILDLTSNTNRKVGCESMDRLAHVLSEQASISEYTHIRTRAPILPKERPWGYKTENQMRSCYSRRRDGMLASALPSQPRDNGSFRPRAGTQADVVITDAEPSLETMQSIRSRRQMDLRPQHNPCLKHLLATMVERNVQCNVQSSAPEHPALTPRSLLPRIISSAEPRGGSGMIGFDDLMDLEVDPNYCEGDDEALLNDTVALRQASLPAGIRKHGVLRYRSSADAGVQSRNMKRNIPRMRRRPKMKA